MKISLHEGGIFDPARVNVIVETNGTIRRMLYLKLKSRGLKARFYGETGEKAPYNFGDPSAHFLRDLPLLDADANYYFSMQFGVGSENDGIELAKAVKARFPNAKTFIVSIYPREEHLEFIQEGVLDEMYPKVVYYLEPFDEEKLTENEAKEVLREQSNVHKHPQFKTDRRIVAEINAKESHTNLQRENKVEPATNVRTGVASTVARANSKPQFSLWSRLARLF